MGEIMSRRDLLESYGMIVKDISAYPLFMRPNLDRPSAEQRRNWSRANTRKQIQSYEQDREYRYTLKIDSDLFRIGDKFKFKNYPVEMLITAGPLKLESSYQYQFRSKYEISTEIGKPGDTIVSEFLTARVLEDIHKNKFYTAAENDIKREAENDKVEKLKLRQQKAIEAAPPAKFTTTKEEQQEIREALAILEKRDGWEYVTWHEVNRVVYVDYVKGIRSENKVFTINALKDLLKTTSKEPEKIPGVDEPLWDREYDVEPINTDEHKQKFYKK